MNILGLENSKIL